MPNDLTGQQVGTQRRVHQTEPKANVLTGRSKFPMSYVFPNTSRYGEISPFYYQHVKGDDIVPLQSEHELRTYTLASPMLTDVQMQKAYAFIPMESIYPRNWERMQVNPDKGDDVPDETRFMSTFFVESLQHFHRILRDFTSPGIATDPRILTHFVRWNFLLESVFSNGSLFSQFNIHLAPLFKYFPGDTVIPLSFDNYFDTAFVPWLKDNVRIILDDKRYGVTSESEPYYQVDGVDEPTYFIPVHSFLDKCRSNSFTCVYSENGTGNFLEFGSTDIQDLGATPINFEIFAAYQLSCFQFYTDSKIDYIFSADRFRSSVESLLSRARMARTLGTDQTSFIFPAFYSYNGEKILYDTFSGRYLNMVLEPLYSFANFNEFLQYDTNDMAFSYVYDYFSLMFTHRNSLRYGDYFVTARTRPYGIGDVNVDTSSGQVSVIDITRRIQIQRFLQSVAWSKQKAVDYAKDVLGIDKPQIVSNSVPQFIANQYFPVNGFEVENTGANQTDPNSITTIIKTAQSRFAFEYHPSNQGIIIGLRSFDCPRIYSRTFDRMHMAVNRYDDFIPEMQFVGDQEIKAQELDVTRGDEDIFGYTLRYMPMKIRTNYCAGGFVENLPSWAMITDNKDGNPFTGVIDPDYIRSSPHEFDRFYTSLTGYSLGSYFHFIHIDKNYQQLTRDMVYAPEPLK